MNLERVAHFRIISELGSGEIGTVYKAFDESLNRQVVIKLLHSHLCTDPDIAARFFKEVQLAASINHPHVLQIYFSGEDHGRIYVVMEAVQGQTLEKMICEQVRLPEALVVSLALEAAQGLQCAHEMGVIHGDLTPAKLLMDDTRGIKILGFGQSQFKLTLARMQNQIGGDVKYFPPERALNEQEDSRSDIYSLGSCLFDALTGQPPFRAPTAQSMLEKKLNEFPISPAKILPNINPATERIILKMLQADPNRRYQSYLELINDLEVLRTKLVTRKVLSKAQSQVTAPSEVPDSPVKSRKQPVRTTKLPGRKFPILPLALLLFGLMAGAMAWFFISSGSSGGLNDFYVKFGPEQKDPAGFQRSYNGKICLVDVGKEFGLKGKHAYGWSTDVSQLARLRTVVGKEDFFINPASNWTTFNRQPGNLSFRTEFMM